MPWGAEKKTSIVYGALLLAALVFTLPGLVRLSKRAVTLAPLDYEARRHAVLGEFYGSLTTLDEALPPETDVAILMSELRDVDRGVFVNYYAYPRRTRFYYGLEQYRHDESPRRPETIWYVDLDLGERVRQMTYDAVRVEQSRELRPIGAMEPFARLEGERIVPLVAALEGRGNERFTTEAVFRAKSATVVRLRLMPDGSECVIELAAGETEVRSDLVPGCFGRTGIGWLRISADAPVETGFWLANRGANVLAPVRLVEALTAGTTRLAGGERIWILNPHPTYVPALVNGAEVVLAPSAVASYAGNAAENLVTSASPFFAFSSRREADGNTTFGWPEARE